MLRHDYIGTEHILLGLIHESEGFAAYGLESLGVSVEAARSQVEEIVGRGEAPPTGHIPFTPRAKKVLELSLKESRQLRDNCIRTEHILLGLIREGEGVGAQVLQKLDADLERVRQRVIELMGVSGPVAKLSEPVSPVREWTELPPFIQDLERKIAETSGEKDVALDNGDLEAAVRLRQEERRLIEEKALSERAWVAAAREIKEKIAEVRRKKEAAIDEGDFERAARLRDEERRLLEEFSSLRRHFDQGGP